VPQKTLLNEQTFRRMETSSVTPHDRCGRAFGGRGNRYDKRDKGGRHGKTTPSPVPHPRTQVARHALVVGEGRDGGEGSRSLPPLPTRYEWEEGLGGKKISPLETPEVGQRTPKGPNGNAKVEGAHGTPSFSGFYSPSYALLKRRGEGVLLFGLHLPLPPPLDWR